MAPRRPGSPVVVQFAIYLPGDEVESSLAIATAALKRRAEHVRLVSEPPAPGELEAPVATVKVVNSEDYAPPSMEALRYFGRGLDAEHKQSLQQAKSAVVVTFGHRREDAWPALKIAYELMEAIGRATNGFIWDEQTRLIYTPESWHKAVVASSESAMLVADHITIHSYRNGDHVRAITLGMSKFGLPDVVVQEFPWSLNRSVGVLINVTCQALAEGTDYRCPGDFDLDLRSIKTKDVREAHVKDLGDAATGVARLQLGRAERQEGDPENELIELGFDRHDGPDAMARQQAMLTEFLGATDAVVQVDHDALILTASERARAKLPELKKAFVAGLQPGEFLLVKAPFKTPDGGREFMWMEVLSWKGGEISGSLQNDPRNIPDLKAGQSVAVLEDEVFDYIRTRPDGGHEGNETGKAIHDSMK